MNTGVNTGVNIGVNTGVNSEWRRVFIEPTPRYPSPLAVERPQRRPVPNLLRRLHLPRGEGREELHELLASRDSVCYICISLSPRPLPHAKSAFRCAVIKKTHVSGEARSW